MRPSRLLTTAAVAASTLVLAACGSDDTSTTAGSGSTGSDSSGVFPVTVEHVFGETVIEEKPERVASVAWMNHEVPLALGVVPVGMSKATWGDDDGDGVLPWVEERLEELGAETPVLFDETEGIDFEAVADTAPDVILASYSGLTQEEYDTLSKIAPVIAYPEVAWGTTYQDMISMNSAALGLADEGEQLVEELDATVTEAFAEHEELAGKNVVFSYLDPNDLSQIGFYTTLDTRPGFLAEYGMGTPEVVTESSAGTDEFYTTVSAERADAFDDVDLIVTYGDQSLARAAQDDPLLSRIPAVEQGAIAMLPDATPLAAAANPTPLSITYNLDEYLDLLAGALA
ncbi:iron-siderophore ABC transporter substrate-binding protein [Nocardioides marinus]|uniref:Iron complex transport system substrate-binding protein n=1 Tax=Nocardioides marinus TaxID=374514 RepID=A0A7Z0C5C7_9ACTN|nr:iron-siderophore ABC transporter substrate-binding protein [Nocardioides marinus]NYI12232.1 iron complex transport system substrate-binding protein [Nocardioides marinus]